MMALDGVHKILAETAQKNGVDPSLVLAIAEVESRFDPFADRFEKDFKYIDTTLKRPSACSLQTEIKDQATSWGLMQVMGIVARELGHTGWLTELTQPEIGANLGAMYLKKKIQKYGGKDLRSAISAYNAGKPITGNKKYVDDVLAAKARWEKALG